MIHNPGLSFSDLGSNQDESELSRREKLRKRLLRIAEGGDMQAVECHAVIDELTAQLQSLSPKAAKQAEPNSGIKTRPDSTNDRRKIGLRSHRDRTGSFEPHPM